MFSRWFTTLTSTLLLVTLTACCKIAPPPNDVALTLSPTAVTLTPAQEQDFVVTVTGSSDTTVTWHATGGTITGSGNTITYTAPATAGAFELTATSVADATKTATAAITVVTQLDPSWAYQYGTSALDVITAVATDAADNVLVAGGTTGSLFGPHQGAGDAFVAKMAPDGSPIWAHQHGTSS